jgi:hypothetical protein
LQHDLHATFCDSYVHQVVAGDDALGVLKGFCKSNCCPVGGMEG